MTTWSFGPESANVSTSVHSPQPSSELTSMTGGVPVPTIAALGTTNRCPGWPVDSPSVSGALSSPWADGALPPTVEATSVWMIGEELYLG